MDNLPKFISFEGTEGVGKTTAIDGFCRHLDTLGIEYVRTREPGGADVAEIIRGILLDKNSIAVQETLKSLLKHHSSKTSNLWHSAFFTVQLSHPYMTTGKTIALTR